jgi:hypothetical protein
MLKKIKRRRIFADFFAIFFYPICFAGRDADFQRHIQAAPAGIIL